ncbi:unnamed protein product [Coccothraustes coccothraustes]
MDGWGWKDSVFRLGSAPPPAVVRSDLSIRDRTGWGSSLLPPVPSEIKSRTPKCSAEHYRQKEQKLCTHYRQEEQKLCTHFREKRHQAMTFQSSTQDFTLLPAIRNCLL